MSLPLVMYDTIQNYEGLVDTITDFGTSSDPNKPPENMLDYSDYTVADLTEYTGTDTRIHVTLTEAVPIDYVAFVNHNIPAGTRWTLQAGPPDYTLIAAGDTTGAGPQYIYAGSPQVADLQFTITFTGILACYVGSLFMGAALPLPEGLHPPYVPPPLGRKTRLYPNQGAVGGHFLGSHVDMVGWEFEMKQDLLEPSWIESNWIPLSRHIEHKPFFYLWDQDNPADLVYAWLRGPMASPRYTSPVHMGFRLQLAGLHER